MTDQLRLAAQKALDLFMEHDWTPRQQGLWVPVATDLRAALAAPQAESAPSAGIEADRYGQTDAVLYDHSLPVGTALYAHPPAPQAEPTACIGADPADRTKAFAIPARSVQEIMALVDELSEAHESLGTSSAISNADGWERALCSARRAALESAVAAQAAEVQYWRDWHARLMVQLVGVGQAGTVGGAIGSLTSERAAQAHEIETLRFELQRETADHAQSTDDALELLRENERLRAALKAVVSHWREFGPEDGFDECLELSAGRVIDAAMKDKDKP